MTGSSEKTCFAEIGLFRQFLRTDKLLVHFKQFGGAVGDALFQRFIETLHGIIGFNRGSNISVTGNNAAIRHRIGCNFNDFAGGV